MGLEKLLAVVELNRDFEQVLVLLLVVVEYEGMTIEDLLDILVVVVVVAVDQGSDLHYLANLKKTNYTK